MPKGAADTARRIGLPFDKKSCTFPPGCGILPETVPLQPMGLRKSALYFCGQGRSKETESSGLCPYGAPAKPPFRLCGERRHSGADELSPQVEANERSLCRRGVNRWWQRCLIGRADGHRARGRTARTLHPGETGPGGGEPEAVRRPRGPGAAGSRRTFVMPSFLRHLHRDGRADSLIRPPCLAQKNFTKLIKELLWQKN